MEGYWGGGELGVESDEGWRRSPGPTLPLLVPNPVDRHRVQSPITKFSALSSYQTKEIRVSFTGTTVLPRHFLQSTVYQINLPDSIYSTHNDSNGHQVITCVVRGPLTLSV